MAWSAVLGAALWIAILSSLAEAEPDGFVSIDCGASGVYFDAALNMTWETDDKYTTEGENGVSDPGNVTFLYRPVPGRADSNTVRTFPGARNRSCYALPATANVTYLVRATFQPWQVSGVSVWKFDVLVGGTAVKTVNALKGDVVEVVLVAPSAAAATVHVCLLRTSPSLHPYISALELRPLDADMYSSMTRRRGVLLSKLDRHNFGVDDAVSKYLRYPEDPYDRIWQNWLGNYDPLNTTQSIDISNASNKPPPIVMATARRLIGYQTIQWLEGITYYISMYFAEFNATTSRTFSVDLDTTPWLVNLNIANKSGGLFLAIQEDRTYTTPGSLGNFTFIPAVGASDKPILNAIEVYQVFENPLPYEPDGINSGSTSTPKYLIPAAAGGGGAALVLIGLILYIFCIWRRRKKAAIPLEGKQRDTSQPSFQVHTIKFTLHELRIASKGFSKKIGEGGFGPVYYGQLASGQEIAIKVSSETSNQGDAEFRNEVDLLSRIHHKSLVSLIGYCQETNQMLIYEYMPSGTLRDHLYGEWSTAAPLDWNTRVHIALDAAEGLEYLHMACRPNIIHRDVKSSNILLTARMEAKVSDFGLSKLAVHEDATHVSTMVKGTAGYLDPEYYTSQKLTVKSDVYSFGVVLLELICGRAPIDPRHKHPNIIDMVRPRVQAGDLQGIVDRHLQQQQGGSNSSNYSYSEESMWKVVEVAMTSVEPKEVHRPNMQQVVHELREAVAMEEHRCSATTPSSTSAKPTRTLLLGSSSSSSSWRHVDEQPWSSASTTSDISSSLHTSHASKDSLPLAR